MLVASELEKKVKKLKGVMATKRSTNVWQDGSEVYVMYHDTVVWTFNNERQDVALQSGGYETVTTKRRINEASNAFGINVHVYQRDFEWVVETSRETFTFQDGMILKVA